MNNMEGAMANIGAKIAAKTLEVKTVEAIMKEEFGSEPWTVESLIPEQSITAITGAPGTSKTWLTIEIARCVATGKDFLNKFKTQQGAVLMVDKENHLRHIQKRLKMLGVENDQIFYLAKVNEFLIDNEDHYRSLARTIKERGVKLVIFDSLVRIHSGDENEAQHISKVMNKFRSLTTQGVTVIFIHHNRKEAVNARNTVNSMRGSSDILAGIDCLLQIKKPEEDHLYIEQNKLRQDEAQKPFRVNILVDKESDTMKFIYGGEGSSDINGAEEIKQSIVMLFDGSEEKSRKEIVDFMKEDYPLLSIDKALKGLIASEIITKRQGAHNQYFFSINNKEN